MTEKLRRFCNRFVFSGIILLLIFTPLAFGAVHVWAYSIVCFCVYSLLFIQFIEKLAFSKKSLIQWVSTPANIYLALFFCLVLIQTVPFPSFLVSIISPKTYEDKIQLSRQLFTLANLNDVDKDFIHFSYYLHPTLVESAKMLSYIGMFFLVVNTADSRKRINIIVYTIVFIGLFQSFYAVYQIYTGSLKVWWWKTVSHFARGTFIYANHFAAYMQLCIFLAVGCLIAHLKPVKNFAYRSNSVKNIFKKISEKLLPKKARAEVIFFFLSTLVMSMGLFFSGSRSGILSYIATMLFVAVFLFIFKKHRNFIGVIVSLFLITIFFGFYLNIEKTQDKFKRIESLHKRLFISSTLIPMIEDYPVVGVGLGNFENAYARYIPPEYNPIKKSGHAYNDWMEATVEVGIVGITIVLIAFGKYVSRLIRILRQRRDNYAIGIGLGAMAALLSISFHSFFDFNMHIPVNPITLAAILGVGFAAVHSQKKKK